MRKKLVFLLAFTIILAGFANFAQAAKKKKWIHKWNAADEIYFILPLPQEMRFQREDTAIVHPWGFGLRAVGNNEGFSGTGGLQVQSVRTGNLNLSATNSFYVFDLFMGLEYMTPKVENKPLRYTASALGGFGLSSGDFFMTSIISAGILYTTEEHANTPVGLSFNLFYRLTETDLNNSSGANGLLEPCFGFKIGYIFKGFWAVEEE